MPHWCPSGAPLVILVPHWCPVGAPLVPRYWCPIGAPLLVPHWCPIGAPGHSLLVWDKNHCGCLYIYIFLVCSTTHVPISPCFLDISLFLLVVSLPDWFKNLRSRFVSQFFTFLSKEHPSAGKVTWQLGEKPPDWNGRHRKHWDAHPGFTKEKGWKLQPKRPFAHSHRTESSSRWKNTYVWTFPIHSATPVIIQSHGWPWLSIETYGDDWGSPNILLVTLWLFNITMENGPFTDDFPS